MKQDTCVRIVCKKSSKLSTRSNLLFGYLKESLGQTLNLITKHTKFYPTFLLYNSKVWIVDSGVSSHMTQKKVLVMNYEELDKVEHGRWPHGRGI